ncbi:MAG: hypothetical protein F4Y07_12125 [Gemmatimonadetes bacterium]|nr:hypothetical protein [Gemmatimonadota bacterium]MYE17217.1 hypothetical protein [Gemmatimonadota bacterium]
MRTLHRVRGDLGGIGTVIAGLGLGLALTALLSLRHRRTSHPAGTSRRATLLANTTALHRGIALALLTIAGCSDVIGPDHTPPLCGDPPPIYAISQHSMTYLSCFDHEYAWDAPGTRHRGHSSDTSVVTVTNKIPDPGSAPYEDNILVLTGHTPGTAVITIEATASAGGVKRHIQPITVRLALDTIITRCDAEPIPRVEGATQLAMDAWGRSNANLKDLAVTGVAGRDTVMQVFMERMGAFTRAEWSVKAAGGAMPQEHVQHAATSAGSGGRRIGISHRSRRVRESDRARL